MKLDYSALNTPATQEDIAAFKAWRTPNQKSDLTPAGGKIISISALALLAYITFSTIASVANSALATLILSILATGVVIGVGIAVLRAVRAGVARQARLYKFALANQAEYLLRVSAPAYPGMIFDEGHSRTILDGLRLPDGTEIGNYQYVTGAGKNRRTHTWSYAGIRLNRKLPHMVLDAKHNNVFGFTNLPDDFGGRKLSLEGDFDKHFALYAPSAYGRDALYIFTPDVMAALIDFGRTYDIEIVDDYLLFYSTQQLTLDSQQQLESLLGVIEIVSKEFHDQSHRYADERTGEPALDVIAEPGRRLKKRFTVLPFVIVVFVYIISYVLGSL